MIVGELRKAWRDKVFLVMMATVLAANIVCILYHIENKSAYYYEVRQQAQQQYIETYRTYLDEMEQRGQELMANFDEDTPVFLRRNVEKTERDYSRLSRPWIDAKYNVGMEEYAQYTYGIFFCTVFAFVCLEYLYLKEQRTGRMAILRTTRNGRRKMLLSKWCVLLLLMAGFTAAQEMMTVCCYGVVDSLGNLSSSVQSLPLFRDCPHAYTLWQGIAVTVLHRMVLAMVIGSVVFFCGVVCDGMLAVWITSCAWLAAQYFFAANLTVNGSFDFLCCINVFHSWDMKNYIGMYHNINLMGIPVEKNDMSLTVNLALLFGTMAVSTWLFAVRYQTGNSKRAFRLLTWLRGQLSYLLHVQSLFVNELYKLLLQQNKWVLPAALALVIGGSVTAYMPRDYGFEGEAVYHMYLANLKGRFNAEKSQTYIEQAGHAVALLEQQMNEANEAGDKGLATQLMFELWDKEAGYQRLTVQYEKLLAHPEAKRYWIDEMNLSCVIKRFDRDVLLFMMSAIVLIMLTSGLMASDQDKQIADLVNTTRSGREKLMWAKRKCIIFLTVILFFLAQLPSWIGYAQVLDLACGGQQLNLLVEWQIDSSMTILQLLVIIYTVKLLMDTGIVMLTALMARRTKNEFVTSVFMSTVVIVAGLVMYFCHTSVTLLVMRIL